MQLNKKCIKCKLRSTVSTRAYQFLFRKINISTFSGSIQDLSEQKKKPKLFHLGLKRPGHINRKKQDVTEKDMCLFVSTTRQQGHQMSELMACLGTSLALHSLGSLWTMLCSHQLQKRSSNGDFMAFLQGGGYREREQAYYLRQ